MTIKTRRNTSPKSVSFFGYIYSNSCGYCKDFESIWEELVPLLSKKNIKHDRFESNVVSDEDIQKKVGAGVDTNKGVPNIFKIVNRAVYYYKGTRDAPSIMKWLSQKDNTTTNTVGLFPGLKGGNVRFNTRTKKGYTMGFINSLKKKYRKTPFRF